MKGSLDPEGVCQRQQGSAQGIWRDMEEEKADAGAKLMFQGQEKLRIPLCEHCSFEMIRTKFTNAALPQNLLIFSHKRPNLLNYKLKLQELL